jgi:2'-5' RNA ligase
VRLFVAVAVGAQVADALTAASDELRKRASTLAPRARITWVPAERAHVTVRFIGHVDEPAAGTIAAALAAPLAVKAFDLTVSGVGAFPLNGSPRVIWAGLTAGVETLMEVEREVSARLDTCGVAPEDRPYHPHLTLGRVKEAGGLRSRALLEGLTDRALGTTRVEAITLFESRLSPKGPTYVPLQQTPLRAA